MLANVKMRKTLMMRIMVNTEGKDKLAGKAF